MGFQGQLGSVNLTDIFQTLHMNRQSGTLSVTGPDETLQVYFDNGSIVMVSAPPSKNGMAFLLAALTRKGMLAEDVAGRLNAQIYNGHQTARQAVLATNVVAVQDLDEVCLWCVEERICPIFDWREGEFVFTDGAPPAELSGPDVIEAGSVGLQTTALLLEASRRNDEWKRIREVITDVNAFYIVDDDGRANLANLQTDADLLKVLRLLDGRRTLDAVADEAGLSRFDTYAIAAQLGLAGVIRPRRPEELLEEANALREQGDISGARTLLEGAMQSNKVPEIIRPLAEICIELRQAPRAVELYLELIQNSQDQGDLEQALADLDIVLGMSPDDPDLQVDRAKVLGELGRQEDSALAFTDAAQALLAKRDIPRAIDACHRAKNLLPRAPDPHRYLAKAYLLDGQTENALVEYKALWHALLSVERPRRAFDLFKEILDSDCRFGGIKEQALNHAQSSEAVKTSKAKRVLIYLACAFLLVIALLVGVQFYRENVVKKNANEDIAEFQTAMATRMNALEHPDLLKALGVMRYKYAGLDDILMKIEGLTREVKTDFARRADLQLSTADQYLAGGLYDKAKVTYRDVIARFNGTDAAGKATAKIEQVRQGEVGAQVQGIIADAVVRWNNLDWDSALAAVSPLADRRDLPTDLRATVLATISDWKAKIGSAQALYERAESIERSGRKKDALIAYRRAANGDGEVFAARARERTSSLELSLARELGEQAQQAFEHGDDKVAFQLLDDVSLLAKNAAGKGVSDYVARLGLPFTIKVDSPTTRLVIRRTTGPERGTEQVIRAPLGTTDLWSHRILYAPNEMVTVEARRAGFAPQTLAISYQNRRSQATVSLSRGPLWQADIEGAPVTSPVSAGKFLLVGTDRSTLEVIDASLGTHRPVTFPQSVDEFRTRPVVFQNFAWTVLDNHAWAVDLATRTATFSWPSLQNPSSIRLNGSLWVQEHELIPGQLLVFVGGVGGTLHTVAIDHGRMVPYPTTDLGAELTGSLVGEQPEPNHTLLYAPIGNQVLVFDTAAATEHSPPTKLYAVRTRGDLIGTAVPAQVSERKALLALDATGLLVAITVGLDLPEDQRAIGSWAIEGTGVDRAVVSDNRAFVGLAEGRVVAADLTRPGQILWRFPAQTTLGGLSGAPVIGRRGLYVADTSGALHCLDPATGTERWRADLGSQVRTGILALDGRIYVPTRNGSVVCFEEGDE